MTSSLSSSFLAFFLVDAPTASLIDTGVVRLGEVRPSVSASFENDVCSSSAAPLLPAWCCLVPPLADPPGGGREPPAWRSLTGVLALELLPESDPPRPFFPFSAFCAFFLAFVCAIWVASSFFCLSKFSATCFIILDSATHSSQFLFHPWIEKS